jgi:hypothetical protein
MQSVNPFILLCHTSTQKRHGVHLGAEAIAVKEVSSDAAHALTGGLVAGAAQEAGAAGRHSTRGHVSLAQSGGSATAAATPEAMFE